MQQRVCSAFLAVLAFFTLIFLAVALLEAAKKSLKKTLNVSCQLAGHAPCCLSGFALKTLMHLKYRRFFPSVKFNAAFILFSSLFRASFSGNCKWNANRRRGKRGRGKQQQLILRKYLCILFIKHSICQLKFINNCFPFFLSLSHCRFVFNLITLQPPTRLLCGHAPLPPTPWRVSKCD